MLVHIGEVWCPDFPRRFDTKQQDTWASCHMLRQGRERTYLLQERRFTRQKIQKVIISANMYKVTDSYGISGQSVIISCRIYDLYCNS